MLEIYWKFIDKQEIDYYYIDDGHKYPTIFAYRFARNLFLPKDNYANKKYPKR